MNFSAHVLLILISSFDIVVERPHCLLVAGISALVCFIILHYLVELLLALSVKIVQTICYCDCSILSWRKSHLLRGIHFMLLRYYISCLGWFAVLFTKAMFWLSVVRFSLSQIWYLILLGAISLLRHNQSHTLSWFITSFVFY